MSRKLGILMPVFALGGSRGIGTFGDAYAFLDFLSECGVGAWQILPLCPTDASGSPYSSPNASGIDPRYIDLRALAKDGLLSESEVLSVPDPERVDHADMTRIAVLKKAYARYRGETNGDRDRAVFMALKEFHGGLPWYEWDGYAPHDEKTEEFCRRHEAEVGFWQFVDTTAREQWNKVRSYAKAKGIEIIGDMPFYVSLDSVEVWSNRDSFDLDGYKPRLVAGVPPDYFAEKGQLWGNPVYVFRGKRADSLWNKRIADAFSLFDRVRLDHFRAFDEFYAVKYGRKDARRGRWYKGPGMRLFRDKLGLPIIAEDLGNITDSVRELLMRTGYPGMRVLQFAFNGDPRNPHHPDNIPHSSVCYTGTHDNMTLMQFVEKMSEDERAVLFRALRDVGEKPPASAVETADAVIELGLSSDAELFVAPLQDFMHLGAEKRINTPGTVGPNNWSVRIREDYTYLKDDIAFLAEKYNRRT